MYHTVRVRNLELGTGIPAICIPNTGRTAQEIASLAGQYRDMPMDLMEWRADWYEDIEDTEKMKTLLAQVRGILGDTPLLFTFRTKKEGGVRELDTDSYIALNQAVAATGMADLIDVELFTGDAAMADLIAYIHANHGKVIASNHDFDKTPTKAEILTRLRRMQDLGADISKIAVMPQNKRDVLTLLCATEEMASDYADRPIITMSMSGLGSISRFSCEVFGSCMTFGAGSMASAPGQIEAQELHNILQSIHRSL